MDLDFHNTRGVLCPNAQPNGLGYGRGIFFVEAHAWTWVSTTHTDLSLRDTPKLGVPRVRLLACVCVHALILITRVLVAYYVGYHSKYWVPRERIRTQPIMCLVDSLVQVLYAFLQGYFGRTPPTPSTPSRFRTVRSVPPSTCPLGPAPYTSGPHLSLNTP